MKTQYQVLRAPISANTEGTAVEVGIYDSEQEAKKVIEQELNEEGAKDWSFFIHELIDH